MARKKKEINKNGAFQVRFRELCKENRTTQEQIAKAVGVSRPTVAGWSEGRSIPDILALAKIASFFHVSADYLLGLSDTVSPDINLKAAASYTGLSEKAVELLHIGLDDFECDGVGISEEMKQGNLVAASALIGSNAFTKMIHHLDETHKSAYYARMLANVYALSGSSDSPEDDSDFHYASKEDREIAAATLIHVLEAMQLYQGQSIPDIVNALSDDQMAEYVINALTGSLEDNERHQFHASKSFTRYIDQVIKTSYKMADQRFNQIKNEIKP